ncbi:MAG: hypothetical protein U5R46_03265 [Gammaproteobacteria bacterium]|nr:hypothetical protein [Gammaproteobacteria bacterium]
MARLFGILVTIFTLSACSSGVSNTGAGAAGTDCSSVDLVCTASIDLDSTSIDVLNDPEEGEEEAATLPASDSGTMNITINDPLGRFAQVFQGVTFETFDVSYESGQGGAPNLGTRRVTGTLTIILSNNTGTGTIDVPIADQVTKQQFRDQASLSTVYPYVVTIRATGRDIATNNVVVVVARTNIEIGNFVDG